jgi:hypothetical protein
MAVPVAIPFAKTSTADRNAAASASPKLDGASRPRYEVAVKFLLVGLGLGSILTFLLASRFDRYSLPSSSARAQATR